MHRERKYQEDELNVAAAELRAYKEMQRQIEYLSMKQAEYRERYGDVVATKFGGVKVSGGVYRDKIADVASQWADLDLKIQETKVRAERELFLINEKLSRLSLMQKRVLELYYINGYSIVKVARLLNYSEEWVKLTKNNALKNYSSSLKECL